MSRPLRFVPEEYTNWTDSYGQEIAVVEITIRSVLGMFLLKPAPQNRSLIEGIMAHVQRRLKFDIYGYAWLWNHGSYLVGVTGPEHQSAIMLRDTQSTGKRVGSCRIQQLGWPLLGQTWSTYFDSRRNRPN